MPYIKQEQRSQGQINNAGQLNYAITLLIKHYVSSNGIVNYQKINDVLGALAGAKLEFYRRLASNYEDQKRKENGDVY